MAREPIGKDAADDVEVRLKALQKLEASIDVITTTAMGAKVDKALQAFGGGSPDPRVQATVARIRTKAAAHDVSAGTKALRRLRRRHKLKQGWARLRPPRWDSTDEDDVFALQAPATTPVAMKVKASPDPTPETPPFVRRFQGRRPRPTARSSGGSCDGWSRPRRTASRSSSWTASACGASSGASATPRVVAGSACACASSRGGGRSRRCINIQTHLS